MRMLLFYGTIDIMQKINFIFIAASYLSIILLATYRDLAIESQALISAIFVFGVGLPHGAVDHVLHKGAEDMFSLSFLSKYIGMMLMVLILWLILPIVALSAFLVVSAYHFGEAQFSDLNLPLGYWSHLLHLSWGSTVLSLLFMLNHHELVTLFARFNDTHALVILFNFKLLIGLLAISGLGLMISSYILYAQNSLKVERFAHEVYVLALLSFMFYVVPLLIAFTLFFCILHSLKVLSQEYVHLKKVYKNYSFTQFITLLSPFTIVSILGSVSMYLLISKGLISVSLLLFSLIAISMITFPHSIVMNKFYQRTAISS